MRAAASIVRSAARGAALVAPTARANAGAARSASALAGQSVHKAAMFDRPMVEDVLDIARQMHAEPRNGQLKRFRGLLEGCVMGLVFAEPSTRTMQSFNMAMQRLGGTTFVVDADKSSRKKGETMHDTVKVLEQNADVLVVRDPDAGVVAEAVAAASIPILNGGDGANEHPTQAMLDIFCMHQELGVDSLDGIEVTLVGDLKYGRTVHSLVQLLALYEGVKINLVAPDELVMPQHYLDLVKDRVDLRFMPTYTDTLATTDILYMTRVQQERFASKDVYERLRRHYVLTREDLVPCKENMAVMHALPRVGEIDISVDEDPRAAYFRQVRCGITTRMALVAMCLGKL